MAGPALRGSWQGTKSTHNRWEEKEAGNLKVTVIPKAPLFTKEYSRHESVLLLGGRTEREGNFEQYPGIRTY